MGLIEYVVLSLGVGVGAWSMKQLFNQLDKRLDKTDHRLTKIHEDTITCKTETSEALSKIKYIEKETEDSISKLDSARFEIRKDIKEFREEMKSHTESLERFKSLVVAHNDKIKYLLKKDNNSKKE